MLPILAVMGVSAAYGLYKAGKGIADNQEAGDVNDNAASVVLHAESKRDSRRDSTNKSLTEYGRKKLNVFNGTVDDFITVFGQIKNIEITATPELDVLKTGDFTTVTLTGLQDDYRFLKASGLGVGTGLGSGAALAFGAYNGTMMLATASTGTAISSLSGVAATNATLAWLGGGSIASGGGGMALGVTVLGSLVAGPAIALFGYIVGEKASAALADAQSNLEKAKTFQKDADLLCKKLAAVGDVVDLASTTFSKISGRLRHSVRQLREVISTQGDNYQNYSEDARAVVLRSVKYAQLIKAMIDTPILDEAGNLVLSTENRIKEVAYLIEA